MSKYKIRALALTAAFLSIEVQAIPSQVIVVNSPNYQAYPSGSYQEKSVFESWAGGISTAGYFHHNLSMGNSSTYKLAPGPITQSSPSSVINMISGLSSVLPSLNPNGKWTFNTAHDSGCFYNMGGPNTCYSANNYKLYFHGEKTNHGDGHLIVSSKPVSFKNGISIETSVRPWCTTGDLGCWINFGLYDGEMNYRAIGFRSNNGASNGFLNIWAPVKEIAFNNSQYGYKSWPQGTTYKLKVQYWKDSAGKWRWDYFFNNSWVAGHYATDLNKVSGQNHYMFGNIGQTDAYGAGAGYFDQKKAYIELGFGGYKNAADGGSIAEGDFGQVTVTRW